jgi:hypothetical protein
MKKLLAIVITVVMLVSTGTVVNALTAREVNGFSDNLLSNTL